MKSIKLYLLLLLSSTLFQNPIIGQTLIPTLEEDQNFNIAGFSSIISPQNSAEINWNNSLTSFWLGIKNSPFESVFRDRLRQSSFVSILDGYYGFSKKGRWNLGLRLMFTSNRTDNLADSSPFKVFAFNDGENNIDFDKTYAGLSGYGLRFRIAPLKKVPEFIINAGYTITNSKSEEYQRNLNAERNILDFTASYFLKLNPTAYYYFNLNSTIYPGSVANDEWLYNSGGGFFLVHLFFFQKLAIYPGISYNITYKSPVVLDHFLIKTAEQLNGTLGIQFQPSNQFSINLSGSVPFLIKNSHLVTEIIRESYSSFNLGMRVVLQ